MRACAERDDFEAVETWLMRLLDLRRSGWSCGVFSIDSHLKNYGVIGERVVLLDPGGLTQCWNEIGNRLAWESSVEAPHVQLGLGKLLASRPDIAQRFDERWRELLTEEGVRRHWPT